MSEQRLSRSRRVGLVGCLAVMLTLVVWWRQSGAVSSPAISTGLFLFIVLTLVVLVRLSRPQAADSGADNDPPTTGPTQTDRRPRAFAEVPREQRLRFFLVIGCATLLFLLIVPLAVLATLQGESLWQAAPLLLLVAASVLAVVWMWRQMRRPTAQAMAAEKQRPKMTMGRHFMAYLVFLPTFVVAGVVYQTLASNTPLALAATFAVNLAGAALVLAIDKRLARKAESRDPQDRPVW